MVVSSYLILTERSHPAQAIASGREDARTLRFFHMTFAATCSLLGVKGSLSASNVAIAEAALETFRERTQVTPGDTVGNWALHCVPKLLRAWDELFKSVKAAPRESGAPWGWPVPDPVEEPVEAPAPPQRLAFNPPAVRKPEPHVPTRAPARAADPLSPATYGWELSPGGDSSAPSISLSDTAASAILASLLPGALIATSGVLEQMGDSELLLLDKFIDRMVVAANTTLVTELANREELQSEVELKRNTFRVFSSLDG